MPQRIIGIMKTTTKKQSKRKVGDIVHYNAIADRGGQLIATIERDESSVELVKFHSLSRRDARGVCVSRGGSLVGIWDCRVYGGSLDGTFCEFAIYEPSGLAW